MAANPGGSTLLTATKTGYRWNGWERAYLRAKQALRGSSGSVAAPVMAKCGLWRRHNWKDGKCVREECRAVKNLLTRKRDTVSPVLAG